MPTVPPAPAVLATSRRYASAGTFPARSWTLAPGIPSVIWADVIVTRLSLPPRWMTWIVAAGLVGFPVAGVLAWVFDWFAKR